MPNMERHFADLDGVTLHYLTAGQGDVVLLVHVIARSDCDTAIQDRTLKFRFMSPWIAAPKPARNDEFFAAKCKPGRMR